MTECNFFSECNAPICPLDESSMTNGVWFCDEDICKRRDFNLIWIKNQKKIKKKCLDNTDLFTVNMLDRKIIVKKGIRGINPDKYSILHEQKWISIHPEKKDLSEEEKSKIRDRFLNSIQTGKNTR